MSFQVPTNTNADNAPVPPESGGRYKFRVAGAFAATKKEMIVVSLQLQGPDDPTLYDSKVFLSFGKVDPTDPNDRNAATINGFLNGAGITASAVDPSDLIGKTGWLDYRHPQDGRWGQYPNQTFYRRELAVKEFGEPDFGSAAPAAQPKGKKAGGSAASDGDIPF